MPFLDDLVAKVLLSTPESDIRLRPAGPSETPSGITPSKRYLEFMSHPRTFVLDAQYGFSPATWLTG